MTAKHGSQSVGHEELLLMRSYGNVPSRIDHVGVRHYDFTSLARPVVDALREALNAGKTFVRLPNSTD